MNIFFRQIQTYPVLPSKKARPPPRDIPAMTMNCQIILILYLIP